MSSTLTTDWTNSESTQTKLYINEKQYTSDPFIHHFCPLSLRRTPEISRGYWARVSAVNHAIRSFCALNGRRAQIVNIGAGFDTLFWRLKHSGVEFGVIVDVDTSQVVRDKMRIVQKTPQLSQMLTNCLTAEVHGGHRDSNSLHSDDYHIIDCDATKFRKLVDTLHTGCGLKRSEPTLFVFECILLYWTEEETNGLLYAVRRAFDASNLVIFDCVNMTDTFARVMQQSLIDRDTPLLGTESCRTLDDWRRRLESSGFEHTNAWDMNRVYEQLLRRDEVERIERLEFLDEKELLTQLLKHYCLVLASNCAPVCW